MFKKARIKLTLWYITIIFLISSCFSIAFYKSSTREIERIVARMERSRQEWTNQYNNFVPPPPRGPSIEELEESKKRLLTSLLIVNGVIIFATGCLAYSFAGKTLSPIKEMVKEQKQFITNSSHELRTPLANLRAEMEANLLEKKISDQMARDLITSNLEEVIRLQTLSNNLLELAKLHQFKKSNYDQKLSLSKLLEVALKRTSALAKKKEISIVLKIIDCQILGDKNSLQELFTILIENAIKYSHEKSEIQIISKLAEKYLKVIIKDQGIGIAANDLPHIFDRFYRADKSRSLVQGFGLGLAIAKEIIEKHRGMIKVKSELGKGSTFTIKFPLKNFK